MGEGPRLAWRRSSYSTSGENCVEVATLPATVASRDLNRSAWLTLKSSHSQQTTDQRVELAGVGGYVAMRDSKDPEGSKLILEGPAWRRLRHRIKAGAFDRR
ncbi:DUF397 domain-containing protein [Spirillospora sp. CA-128828]|uniref:DUF397 domain-containing protein n=1 Tax=Spirillospora sp. CA-128828 TaxID=3240033 RepID=UPI003D8ED0AF